jgi:ketosteroid isomerase-like protein
MSDDEHTTRVRAWVNDYIQAWNSNDPGTISRLFTEDAAYYTEPHSQPWRGRDEIVRQWLRRKDEPGETRFRWHPLTVSAELAVVQGTTLYRDPPRTYSNLWVIRLDADGRCAEFTEWWMQHP